MASKMLVDAAHPEETRVVVLRGNRVEEFDFESATRRQLRGNIYLAKVTRVEPSLQAAFIDYGGNRHGFLAFSEIHPDYYQIPVADRQALIAEEERAHRESEAEHERRAGRRHRERPRRADRHREAIQSDPIEAPRDSVAGEDDADPNEALLTEAQAAEAEAESKVYANEADPSAADERPHDADRAATGHEPAQERLPAEAANELHPHEAGEPQPSAETHSDEPSSAHAYADQSTQDGREPADVSENGDGANGADVHEAGGNVENVPAPEGEEDDAVESVGGADAMEEVPDRAPRFRRQYKIQEVIKRRQVMLVQVVKEERGTKGAALTTYLSLAGRYSVLMPNTARGGGISRKITSSDDRRRLKEIALELEVPEGMGVILRTAGAARTKAEVVRDFEYLLRVWEQVRDLTLKSTAPTLVYEEGSLVKRSIRDLYNKEVDEIVVAGDAAYAESKDFMRMLMPSHAKIIKLYRDAQPVFSRYGIESQLDAMFSPTVQLKSGGYIVLNQTEALVSIDVNSGRATREHHIEDTALKTNLEASEEIARQLRLRDLAGLIVIDFIDMDEKRNNRAVERRLKDALKNDRARIQVGRISHFGLMEMSRQRIRSSVLESSTDRCPHCGGTGHLRSVSSVALQLLRLIEETLLRGATHNLIVRTGSEVALYILNNKRGHLRDLEDRFQITITVNADAAMGGQQPFLVEKGEMVHSPEQARAIAAAAPLPADDDEGPADDEAEDTEAEVAEGDIEPELESAEAGDEANGEAANGDDSQPRRRRRRRGRRGGRDREQDQMQPERPQDTDFVPEFSAEPGTEQPPHREPPADDIEIDGDAPHERSSHRREPHAADAGEGENGQRRRRRGRRGGRRNRRDRDASAPFGQEGEASEGPEQEAHVDTQPVDHDQPRERSYTPHEPEVTVAVADLDRPPAEASRPAPEPGRRAAPELPREEAAPAPTPRKRSTVREPFALESADPPAPVASAETAQPVAAEAPPPAQEENKPRRTGWWAKRLLGG